MKKILFVLFALMIIGVSVTAVGADGDFPVPLSPEGAPPAPEFTGELIDETPSMWFVQLESAPAVDGTSMKDIKAEQKAFRAEAKAAGLTFEERFAFGTLWNGMSIKIDPADVGKLARIKGVQAIFPVQPVAMPEVTTSMQPELFTAIQMTGADIAQSELGYTGEGVKVAVMDTGIDYDHPDLGGCFGEGCRVAFGYDLVGDDFNADDSSPSFNPIATPDDDPDDCGGHGTHVAGIVGANGTVKGVAPNVTFGAYRVFGCEGSTFTDIMIQAMELALADDMDILNMSIGSSFAWPQYPTAVASNNLVNKGMVVVASIGNSGTSGTFAAGAPGVGKKVIGVASFDNTNTLLPYFTVADEAIGYVPMTNAGLTPTSGTEEIVFVGRGCDVDPFLADPAGKVALIVRGACSFAEKAENAIDAGAVAVVVHNNVDGVFNGTLGDFSTSVPVVGISLADGLFIQGLEPVAMTWTDLLESSLSPTGGLISAFSSYGLAADLSLKPDIGAPGGDIYSTYPLEKGGYATMGGTSMASPHVAGAAALLLEAKPKTPSQQVRNILQNSADPQFWSLAPAYGLLDHVHRQGAGMVDIDDAILATTKIEPGKISLGESEAGPQTVQLTIENNGSMAVTYDLSFVSAVATTGTWASQMGYWLTGEYIDFSNDSISVPAGGSMTVTATFYPPAGPDLGQYGGYIVFTPQDAGQVFRVPYAGFVGDYQDLSVLFANPYGLPWIIESADLDFVYTMENGDIPDFWVNFGHQARTFRMEVFDAQTGRNFHRAYDLDYMGRNSNYNSIYSFPFDGTTVNGKKVNVVPNGEYYVVISVLKALGDSNNPDHWETWTSPTFVIERP